MLQHRLDVPLRAPAFARQLANALEASGKPCRVYAANLRVRVEATDFTCYPDASVVCGKLETSPVDHNAALNTILVAEVLSDWTEAYDRGVKASHYRPIPAIREYVLVSQHSPLIEVWRKNDQARWELAAMAGKGEHAELPTAEGWLARGMLRAREVHGSPPPQSADPGRGRRSRHDGL